MRDIAKNAIIFAGIQSIGLISKLIVNKAAAMILGPSGLGIIAILNTIVSIFKTVCAIGISQSSIRDISVAKAENNPLKLLLLLEQVNRLILWTSAFGFIATASVSWYIVYYFFNIQLSTIEVLSLAIGVYFTILFEGKISVLKGLREVGKVAKSIIWISLITLLVSVLMYYYLKIKAAILIIAIVPVFSCMIVNYYTNKNITHEKNTNKESKLDVNQLKPIIIRGLNISITIIFGQISSLLITSIVSKIGGVDDVGLYSAGVMLMTGYFSAVISAITSDYYPRIATCINNQEINNVLNQQIVIICLLCTPAIIVFISLLPEIIVLVYSDKFATAADMVAIGVVGVLITLISNLFDLLLLAKNNNKVYVYTALMFRIVEILVSTFMYQIYGLKGLGYAILITAIVHALIMFYLCTKIHKIVIEVKSIRLVSILLCSVCTALIIKECNYTNKSSFVFIISSFICFLSFLYYKKIINKKNI